MEAELIKNKKNINLIILVAALGYFVDIYDLVLFGIVRVKSLKDMGLSPDDIEKVGISLMNWQMAGMLLGGIFWGMLGDKKGRLSVLFGSILMYSLANIANGFVHTTGEYALWRFIAGIGLAGELGAGITLVSETMSKENRGYGTTIVATVGVFGAVVAGLLGDVVESWRTSYFIGGAMGISLLLLRIGIYESGMYHHVKASEVSKGNFLSLFSSFKKAKKYFNVIMIAVPVWYVMGILIILSPEMSRAMGMEQSPNPGKSIMFAYIGITVGDIASGLISQWLRSRKKVIGLFLLMTVFCIAAYFTWAKTSLQAFYIVATCIGFATGYWAVFMSTASESFGTNIRATVTTTAPNFVRGAVIPLTFAYQFLKESLHIQAMQAAVFIGIVTFVFALYSAYSLEETFDKDLNYIED
jgi:putative MFS transporter